MKLKINLKNALQIKNEVKKLINIETNLEINFKNQNNFESKLKNNVFAMWSTCAGSVTYPILYGIYIQLGHFQGRAHWKDGSVSAAATD